MHRSSSFGNKTTYQKTINKNYVLHLERLQKIRSTSSQTHELQNKNSQLLKNSSILRQNNRKKELETELTHIKIDRENKILLDKMTKIVNRSTIENPIKITKSESRPRSLNEHVRKLELEKIMMQNQGIINRLRQQTSFYNVKHWEKDYKMRETYLKNMAEYTLHEGAINAQTERAMRRTVAMSTIESPEKRGSVQRRTKLSFSIKPSLSTLPAGASGPHSRTESTSRRVVLYKKEAQINGLDYLVEFVLVEGTFQIAMYRKDDLETKCITYDEQKGRVLLLEYNNRYDKIISKIDFKDGEPFIKGFGFDSVLHESTKIELFNSFPKEEEQQQQQTDKVDKKTEIKQENQPAEGKDEVKVSVQACIGC